LEKVVWRGRCEMKVDGDITWYLDGAHTADSIVIAVKWFGDEVSNKYDLFTFIQLHVLTMVSDPAPEFSSSTNKVTVRLLSSWKISSMPSLHKTS
jgi:folylpolyglutamate synthase/dihydropteroate synthase